MARAFKSAHWTFLPLRTVLVALTLLAVAAPIRAELVVYTAQLIRTMEPALPTATAVAVEDGVIVAVGSEDTLQPLIEARSGRVDRLVPMTFCYRDSSTPYVHPALPAVLTQFPFLAPDDWSLPTGEFPGETTPGDIAPARSAGRSAQRPDRALYYLGLSSFVAWRDLARRSERAVWGAAGDALASLFPELIGNDAAWSMLGVTMPMRNWTRADWARALYENGLKAVVPKLGFLFTTQRFGGGMFNFLAMLHQAGVTTALDMGTGIYGNPVGEIAGVRAAANAYPVPVRLILTPIIVDFLTRGKTPEEHWQKFWRGRAITTTA